ncbi:hypothetical protein ABZX40_34505 [Streptomyces sp. NPDC004610]|uniref:hypothetical protein n=1 Tax=unclassified Streptomyces TaxID=2593676 RepID=UPI0033B6A1BC
MEWGGFVDAADQRVARDPRGEAAAQGLRHRVAASVVTDGVDRVLVLRRPGTTAVSRALRGRPAERRAVGTAPGERR